jgi:arylamine N-acetyltransferase
MASAYSPGQIETFLDYIGIPEQHRRQHDPELNLEFLTNLHVHTLSAIPYENLSLHYNEEHSNTLDPQKLYQKIVLDGCRRGGYCMEVSLLFNHILRGLGFDIYTAGVKIRRRQKGIPDGPYTGHVHIVNIVTLSDGSKWMCDVAFGGDGATKPLQLLENEITHNMGTQEIRLVKEHIPAQIDRRPQTKMWIYQYRNSPTQAWNSFYAFHEVEFTAEDFDVMNWYTGHWPDSPQLSDVLVIKFLRRQRPDCEGGAEIFGKRMLVGGTVKENLGGKTKVVATCFSEVDRIAALEEWFDIKLTEAERRGIVGWRTELHG